MFRPGVGWQKVYVLTAMDAKKLEGDIRSIESALGRAPEEWAPVAVIDTSMQGFLYVFYMFNYVYDFFYIIVIIIYFRDLFLLLILVLMLLGASKSLPSVKVSVNLFSCEKFQ